MFKRAMMLPVLLVFIGSAVFAQDTSMGVSPTYIFFADETPGVQSEAVTITLTNKTNAAGMVVGTVTMGGPNSADFNLSSDNCSGQSLAENTSCTLQVKFAPRTNGVRSALVTIPYGSSGTKLSVFLSNHEDTRHEAQRRLPPMVYDLNIPEEMNASSSYNLDWTAMGYHSGYQVVVAMFDCTNEQAGTCGASYDSPTRFYESTLLSPTQVNDGEWFYNGENIQNFHYNFTFNIDAKRPDGSDWDAAGTPIVIRFYVKSTEDSEAEKQGLSLLIPGNLSNDYYDTSGRKIQKTICPASGCTP